MSTTDWADEAADPTADPTAEPARAVGVVPDAGRGSLPFSLVHGESLVAAASWALAEAGVELLDFDVTWPAVRDLGRPVVFHDPLCPLTPAAFITALVDRARASGVVQVAVRPVTDTIKSVAGSATDGVVGATVDRDALLTVTSPVVLPAAVAAALADARLGDADLVALVTALRDRFEVRFVEAPSIGRRVEDTSSVRVLEAFAEQHPGG